MVNLILYQLDGCPYCELVRQKLEEKGLLYDTITVPPDRSDPLRRELLEKSGVLTVPVLRINDFYLGESAEIVAYVEEQL